jgi:hypothetical protein
LSGPLIIVGKTKACAVLWQLGFAQMRPLDAAMMVQTSIAPVANYSARREINLAASTQWAARYAACCIERAKAG